MGTRPFGLASGPVLGSLHHPTHRLYFGIIKFGKLACRLAWFDRFYEHLSLHPLQSERNICEGAVSSSFALRQDSFEDDADGQRSRCSWEQRKCKDARKIGSNDNSVPL